MPEGYVRAASGTASTLDAVALRGGARRGARRPPPPSRARARRRDLVRVHRADHPRHGRRGRLGVRRAPSRSRAAGSATRTSSSTTTCCRCSRSCVRAGLQHRPRLELGARRPRVRAPSRARRRRGHQLLPPRQDEAARLDLPRGARPARRRARARPRWSATRSPTTSKARSRSGCARSSSTATGSIRTSSRGSTALRELLPPARLAGVGFVLMRRLARLGSARCAARRGGDLHARAVLPRSGRARGASRRCRRARSRRAVWLADRRLRRRRPLASLAVLRPIARAHLHMPRAIRTGTAALEGAHAVVLQRVDGTGGRVRIGGEEWSARSYMPDEVLEPGTQVEVAKIEGATALVYRIRS